MSLRSARRDDGYVVELADRAYEADQVVVATGPFQTPFVPALAAHLDPGVVQFHSAEYRNPEALPDGPVLVVGGGNTGFQIAAELAATREVHLSIGSRQTPLPQRLLGRDLFRWLDATGLMRKHGRLEDRSADEGPRHADRLDAARAAPAHGIRAARPRRWTPRARRSRSPTERASTFDTVIWATGFRLDHSWIDAPVFDAAAASAPPRGDRSPGPVLPRTAVAAHEGLGPARLGQGRRRVPRAADRRVRAAERTARRARRPADGTARSLSHMENT